MIESKNYMKHLVEQSNLHFIVTGKVKQTGQIVTAMKVVTLHNPKLTITVWNDALVYSTSNHTRAANTFKNLTLSPLKH